MGKKIVILLVVLLAAINIICGAIYYLLFMNPEKKESLPSLSVLIEPGGVVVEGAITASRSLAGLAKSPGTLVIQTTYMTYIDELPLSEAIIVKNPTFPHKFRLSVGFERLKPEPMFVRATYCPGEINCNLPLANPIKGSLYGASSLPAASEWKKGTTVSAGYTYLMTRSTIERGHQCTGDVLISGKVVPTAAVNKSGKYALIITPGGPVRLTGDKITTADLKGHLLHQQFLNFATGQTAFSVPAQKTPAPNLRVYVQECAANDSLDQCVLKAFPLNRPPKKEQPRYKLLGKGSVEFACGMTNIDAIFHPVVTAVEPLGPPEQMLSNTLPEEIVEGALF